MAEETAEDRIARLEAELHQARRETHPQGLHNRFRVQLRGKYTDSGRDEYVQSRDVFVLVPKGNPADRAALAAYIDACRETRPQLAADLEEWLAEIDATDSADQSAGRSR